MAVFPFVGTVWAGVVIQIMTEVDKFDQISDVQ